MQSTYWYVHVYHVSYSEERKIAAVCVTSFCAEGDNAADALNMASHLNSHFKWLDNAVSFTRIVFVT